MSQKKLKGLTSTIVLGILLIVALFFAKLLFSVNLSEGWGDYGQSLQGMSSDFENAGEIGLVLVLVAAMGALAIAIISYLIAFLTFLSSSIPLIFSIKNYRLENKLLKVVNVVYSALFSAISLFAQIKVILFFTGIG